MVARLRHSFARYRFVGETISLDQLHICEVIGEGACCE
jgi:hypothetical protein